LFGSLILPSLFGLTVLAFRWELGWFAAPVGLLIAFFLWLVGEGYQNKPFARGVLVGYAICFVLSVISFLSFEPAR
jgi:hypothetical protein